MDPSACPTADGPAILSSGCALCCLAEKSTEHSLRAFFAEFVNDPQVRADFRRARGFCAKHLPLLAHCGDALGVSIIYADLAGEAVSRWKSGAVGDEPASLLGWLRPVPRRAAKAVCPSCAAEAEAEHRYAAALAQGLARDPALWDVVIAGGGLCSRHVETVAKAARPADSARLLNIQAGKMEALLRELEEFVRKNDYRFKGEPWGSERDAWRRALARLRP